MPRHGGRGGGPRGRVNRGDGLDHTEAPSDAVVCYICAEPAEALCVFPCGHSTCYSCGLRIHALNHGGCPVCRTKGDVVFPIVTRTVSKDEEQYTEEEMQALRACATVDRKLKCTIDGPELAVEVAKLYEFVCPMESCWRRGEQDPFFELAMLKDHMQVDHKLSYCTICLEHRPAFLCEQALYSEEALRQHMLGRCPQDNPSFTGHPPCKFCTGRHGEMRFYDGEALLKHMQQSHFTCDVCNRGQFTFAFYANRSKLNQHFERSHKICDHPDCQGLDLMLRVFADELELAIHKQRVHGAKAKLTLNIGSFVSASPSSPTSGTGGGSGATATGSNTNVLHITFDHIFRRETVEMLPARSTAALRQTLRGNRGGGGGAKAGVHVPQENGLPIFYRRPGVLTCLRRGGDDAGDDGGTAPGHHVDPGSPVAAGTYAFGVSESMESYNAKNCVPADPGEQERLLNELLSREVTSPVMYAHFRSYTREFIESKIMTTEYFDLLSKEIFPDRRVFAQVFPLLVATVPNAEKKTALQEVWKMRTAPEQQRRMRAEEEEAVKRAADEARAQQEAIWREIKSGGSSANHGRGGKQAGNGRGGAKQNAWLSVNKTAKLQTQGPSTSGGGEVQVASSPAPQPASSWSAHAAKVKPPTALAPAQPVQPAGSVWADSGLGPSGAVSSPLPRASASYEELFPSLPTTGHGHRTGGQRKAAPKKANAWFLK